MWGARRVYALLCPAANCACFPFLVCPVSAGVILKNQMDVGLRRVIVTAETPFRPFRRYGRPVNDLEWLPLTKGDDGSNEMYLIRFKPGASSVPHEHVGQEEFLVLEGELEDCDGKIMKAGDYVVYPTHGVGKITGIETQEIAGQKLKLFVIEFEKEKMILLCCGIG